MFSLYRFLFLFIVSLLINIDLRAQIKTYKAQDGTQVALEILNVNPDEGRNASIFLGAFGPEGMHHLGANYYNPGKYFINGLIGFSGGNIDGSFFLKSKVKDITMRQSVKMSHYTKYVVKTPGKQRTSFGLHLGANSVDYSKVSEGPSSAYSAIGLFGGFSILQARHTKWKIYDSYKQAQGTLINRLNADIIYYLKRELPSDYEDTETIDDVSRKFGFRIYYDGKTILWSRAGRISLNYMLGFSINSNKEISIPFFAGLGLGYNF